MHMQYWERCDIAYRKHFISAASYQRYGPSIRRKARNYSPPSSYAQLIHRSFSRLANQPKLHSLTSSNDPVHQSAIRHSYITPNPRINQYVHRSTSPVYMLIRKSSHGPPTIRLSVWYEKRHWFMFCRYRYEGDHIVLSNTHVVNFNDVSTLSVGAVGTEATFDTMGRFTVVLDLFSYVLTRLFTWRTARLINGPIFAHNSCKQAVYKLRGFLAVYHNNFIQ